MNKQNAVIGQSGGPTAAINATLAGVISGALENDKINKDYQLPKVNRHFADRYRKKYYYMKGRDENV